MLRLSGFVFQPSFSAFSLLPWTGYDNLLLLLLLMLVMMLLKARSPLENSLTCLSGRISMEDLQSQRSTSMDWLSKFTGPSSLRSHCSPLMSSESPMASKTREPLVLCFINHFHIIALTQLIQYIFVIISKVTQMHWSDSCHLWVRTGGTFSCSLNVVVTNM